MAAPQFSGAEPLVGEVVGLRTFRVDEAGLLLPLFTDNAWYDGTNTASCTPPTGEAERTDHPIADAGCRCGFYAYGSTAAAARNRNMRYVRAVVSCWGGVIAGTQGVRAQHARIDALWLAPSLPASLRARVAAAYPSARLYRDVDAMLAEHPLSRLPCYEPPAPRRMAPRVALGFGGAALLALGLLPAPALAGSLHALWLAALASVAVVTGWLLVIARGAGHVTAGLVAAGVLAWLAAPALGLAGWLLRLPILRALAVVAGGWLLALRPGYFPVVRSPSSGRPAVS